MAISNATFELQTVGNAPTTAESDPTHNWDDIEALSGTILVANTNPMHGAKHLSIANPGTGMASLRWSLSSAATIDEAIYFNISALPSGADVLTLASVSDSSDSSSRITLSVLAAGTVRLISKGTTVYTTTATVSTSTWYRVDLFGTASTNGSNGTLAIALFTGDALTATEDSGVLTGRNTADSLGAFGKVRVGKLANTTNAYTGTILLDTLVRRSGTDAATRALPYAPDASTTIYPLSVLDNSGAWTIGGGSVTVAQALGDVSDSTYIRCPDATGGNKSVTVFLPPLAAGATVVATPRLRLVSGSSTTPVDVVLKQGATTIATRTESVTSTSAADFPITLTSGEVSAITDRAQLSVTITAKAS